MGPSWTATPESRRARDEGTTSSNKTGHSSFDADQSRSILDEKNARVKTKRPLSNVNVHERKTTNPNNQEQGHLTNAGVGNIATPVSSTITNQPTTSKSLLSCDTGHNSKTITNMGNYNETEDPIPATKFVLVTDEAGNMLRVPVTEMTYHNTNNNLTMVDDRGINIPLESNDVTEEKSQATDTSRNVNTKKVLEQENSNNDNPADEKAKNDNVAGQDEEDGDSVPLVKSSVSSQPGTERVKAGNNEADQRSDDKELVEDTRETQDEIADDETVDEIFFSNADEDGENEQFDIDATIDQALNE